MGNDADIRDRHYHRLVRYLAVDDNQLGHGACHLTGTAPHAIHVALLHRNPAASNYRNPRATVIMLCGSIPAHSALIGCSTCLCCEKRLYTKDWLQMMYSLRWGMDTVDQANHFTAHTKQIILFWFHAHVMVWIYCHELQNVLICCLDRLWKHLDSETW